MGILSDLFGWLKSFFTDLLQMLEDQFLWVFAVAFPALAAMAVSSEQILAWLADSATWIWTAAGNLLESLWGSCLGFIEGAIEWILETAGQLIDWVVEEIIAIAGAIGNAILGGPIGFLIGIGLFVWLLMKDKGGKNQEIDDVVNT
jgi:flagellar biosynthesis protein FliR